jgi:hypothetical protein
MVCNHSIFNIRLFVTQIESSLIEIITIEKNSFILYYGFFKYERIDTNV